jgi:hypothetical protein
LANQLGVAEEHMTALVSAELEALVGNATDKAESLATAGLMQTTDANVN